MNVGGLQSTVSGDETAAPLIRRLAARYLLVLAAVALLILLDQAMIQPALLRFNAFAPAINQAGRQRMLSQRLTKAALAMQIATDDATRAARREELADTLAQWETAHELLKSSLTDKARAPDLALTWSNLEPHYRAMCAAAHQLLDSSVQSDQANASTIQAIDELVSQEPKYLPEMEQIVALLEQSSNRQVGRLRLQALGISMGIMALLLALGCLVVLPATRALRTQVDSLELRVASRTAELTAANRSLEHEIAERQQSELEKQRLSAELAHVARVSSLGHLATGLAHEINQPLAAIANYSEACELSLERAAPANPQVSGYFQQIKSAALRAGQIVRRIRNFVQPMEGDATATPLAPLIREVVELCRFELDQASVRCSLDLAEAEGERVLVDGVQIQQVLVNLIQNSLYALRTTPLAEREISIAVATLPELMRIEFSDTGSGFGARDPASLFAPYFTTKEDGLGIGLSLCRSIIERHGGSIWAESLPDRGARLSFTLPRSLECDDVRREDHARREAADCVHRR